MKKIISLLLICLSCSFGEENGLKNYYVTQKEKNITVRQSYKTVNPRKTVGRKKWYEVDWNQGVKLCPEKDFNTGNGTWIVNGTSHVDSLNCVYVDGSPYTRSILVLYAKNENDLKNADSSWVLVNQTIVNLKGKKFTIYKGLGSIDDRTLKDTSYTVQMEYDLIVDKTELRVRDALWLREGEKVHEKQSVLWFYEDYYPSSDSLMVLDYPSQYYQYYLSFRSQKDGLESVLNCPKLTQCSYNKFANGYRLPYYDEWYILQNAGQSKVFSWGNEFVEDSLKKYADIHCAENVAGLYPVKRYAPNQFGLYDTYGNAYETYFALYDDGGYLAVNPCSISGFKNPGKACRELLRYKCLRRNTIVNNATFKTPGFQGLRMVRKLE
ncbi:MAG: SUMF1/EgtB/PvdO family nonheme iron enzyme [Fibrobacter sp.]|nr:SUMF1/EgtB/PvdO family nonheme iron enzyme [Fibrobacter sp.]